MKLLTIFLILILISTGSYADTGDDKDEWKFISVVTLSKEETQVEISKTIATIKESDRSQEDINRMVEFWTEDLGDDKVVYNKLSQSELDANFPQLLGLKKQSSYGSGMTIPQITTHVYEPEIIDDISVNSRKLVCKFEQDEIRGLGQLCKYTTALSYYSHKPEDNFIVKGDITPQRAVEIAKAWIDGTFIASEAASDRLPKWLSFLSYSDGKYVIRYSDGACWGSVEVVPETVNNVLHLKIAPEADMWCA